MKKILLVVTAFATFFMSCSTDSNDVETSKVPTKSIARYTAADFAYIGTEHNRIVDLTYHNFNDNNLPYMGIQDASYSFIVSEVSKYQTTPEDKAHVQPAVYETMYYEQYTDTSNHFWNETDSFTNSHLSAQAKSYLDELRTIIYSGNTLSKQISDIQSLEAKATANSSVSNQELSVIFSATNVGKSSLTYWTANASKWNDAFTRLAAVSGASRTAGEPQMTTLSWGGDIFDVVAADCIGAVAGAASAWAINVWVGPGQAAYGAWVVGTAVSSSVLTGGIKIANAIKKSWVKSRH